VAFPAQQARRPFPQEGLVVGCDQPVRRGVRDHGPFGDQNEGPLGPTPIPQKPLEHEPLRHAGGIDQTLLDLARRPPGERQHQRARVLHQGGKADHPEDAPMAGIGDRCRSARHRDESVGKMFPAHDRSRAPLRQGRSNAVGADQVLGVEEARRQEDAVEFGAQQRVSDAAVHHMPPLAAQEDGNRRTGQVIGELLEHGTGSPDEQPVAVDVRVERHLEVVRPQTARRRPSPGGGDVVADLGGDTAAGEELCQGGPQVGPKEGSWQDHIRSGGHAIPFHRP